MPKPRVSVYKSRFFCERKRECITKIKHMKEGEKVKMQGLNDRLVDYFGRVHQLEMNNKCLKAENAKLQKLVSVPDCSASKICEKEFEKLRIRIEQLESQRTCLEIQKDNLCAELEEVTERWHQTEERCKNYEKEAKCLRHDVNDFTMQRESMKRKIVELQEAMELQKQVSEAKIESLITQLEAFEDEALVLNFEHTSLIPDLKIAIADVRKEYEQLNSKALEDLDAFYKKKVCNLTKELKKAQEKICETRTEDSEKRKAIHRLEIEIEPLRNKIAILERDNCHLEKRLSRERAECCERIKELQKELDCCKEDRGRCLKDCQNLYSLKVSLEQEIGMYQKLLTTEEARITEISESTSRCQYQDQTCTYESSDDSDPCSAPIDYCDYRRAKPSRCPKTPACDLKTPACDLKIPAYDLKTPRTTPKATTPRSRSASRERKFMVIRAEIMEETTEQAKATSTTCTESQE